MIRKSNIAFLSNLFPAGRGNSDKDFIAQVTDYYRLRHIDKVYSDAVMSKVQREILHQHPYCALDSYKDPCFGIPRSGDSEAIVCRCLENQCPMFSSCRGENPPSEDEIDSFKPRKIIRDEYGYKAFRSSHPVFLAEDNDYAYNVDFLKVFAQKHLPAVPTDLNIKEVLKKEETKPDVKIIPDNIDDVEGINSVPDHDEKKANVSHGAIVPSKSNEVFSGATTKEEKMRLLNQMFLEVEKRSIIEADPKDNIFVDAGPGTGKTYTLLHKLNYMVTELDTDPEGIVVLCFTNAAVDEIKERLRDFVADGASRALLNVDVRTFHSFAGWLKFTAMEEFGEKLGVASPYGMTGYDYLLKQGCGIIRRHTEEYFSGWEHFIVDEVQDITNILAEFVLTIMKACVAYNCGITILGDTCQAIYGWSKTAKDESPIDSDTFYIKVYEILHNKCFLYRLKENYRQTSKLQNLTKDLRSAILGRNISHMAESAEQMFEKVDRIDACSVDISESDLERCSNGGNVCILVRGNADALKISSDFHKRGIKHRLNVDRNTSCFAPWIADVFAGFSKPQITKQEFKSLYDSTNHDEKYSADYVWSRFEHAIGVENSVFAIKQLLSIISKCKIDDPVLRAGNNSSVIVSNIHRSKGREYDGVIIEEKFAENLSQQPNKISYLDVEEYRVLYVAATRPKSFLAVAPLLAGGKLSKFKYCDNRYGKLKDNRITYLEYSTEKDNNPNLFSFANHNLLDEVEEDDEIVLRRELFAGNIVYQIIHEKTGRKLGNASSSYVDCLAKLMGIDRSNLIKMPARINDLYVSGIYSFIVDSDELRARPDLAAVNPNGVWKWLEISGVGHAFYDSY